MKTIAQLPAGNEGNWNVIVQCKYCKQGFEIEADFSNDIIVNKSGQRVRLIVLRVLEECPDCHSLHVIKKK